jgi:hypothetical protein
MPEDKERCRKAANILADLLSPALRHAEEERRHLYIWEREAIEWLRDQWRRDPGTWLNAWIGERYVLNERLDLDGKVSAEMVG